MVGQKRIAAPERTPAQRQQAQIGRGRLKKVCRIFTQTPPQDSKRPSETQWFRRPFHQFIRNSQHMPHKAKSPAIAGDFYIWLREQDSQNYITECI